MKTVDISETIAASDLEVSRSKHTLVNVNVSLPVFTSVVGRSYAHFIEQNGCAHDVNR